MWREGIPITGRGYYILDSDCQYFYNISVREPRVSTDHRMILSKIRWVRNLEEPQIPQRENHLTHCCHEEGHNAGGVHRFHSPPKRGKKTTLSPQKYKMDFGGDLMFGAPANSPETPLPSGLVMHSYGNQNIPGIPTVGYTEAVKYKRGKY